jgi:hypothetical protein
MAVLSNINIKDYLIDLDMCYLKYCHSKFDVENFSTLFDKTSLPLLMIISVMTETEEASDMILEDTWNIFKQNENNFNISKEHIFYSIFKIAKNKILEHKYNGK